MCVSKIVRDTQNDCFDLFGTRSFVWPVLKTLVGNSPFDNRLTNFKTDASNVSHQNVLSTFPRFLPSTFSAYNLIRKIYCVGLVLGRSPQVCNAIDFFVVPALRADNNDSVPGLRSSQRYFVNPFSNDNTERSALYWLYR